MRLEELRQGRVGVREDERLEPLAQVAAERLEGGVRQRALAPDDEEDALAPGDGLGDEPGQRLERVRALHQADGVVPAVHCAASAVRRALSVRMASGRSRMESITRSAPALR